MKKLPVAILLTILVGSLFTISAATPSEEAFAYFSHESGGATTNATTTKSISLDMEKAVGGFYATTKRPLWNLIVPVDGGRITSLYGPRNGDFHHGLDFGLKWGAFVLAAQKGVVTRASFSDGYGNFVEIDHGSGILTRYAHLSSYPVGVGEKIEQGQIVGSIGNTGNSSAPHLHFEVVVDGNPKDPLNYLPISLEKNS